MKKVFLISVIFSFCFYLSAQISEGGLPRSFKSTDVKSSTSIAKYTLSTLDTAKLLDYNKENPLPMRYAVLEEVSIDLKSAGNQDSTI